jgi:hypothetical protein
MDRRRHTALGRRALALVLAAQFAVLAVAGAAGSAGSAGPNRPRWLSPLFYRIGVCETGLNWQHSTRDFVSAFGIARSAWADYRPRWVPVVPERATARQQYAVARSIQRHVGLYGWGCWRHNSWVRG